MGRLVADREGGGTALEVSVGFVRDLIKGLDCSGTVTGSPVSEMDVRDLFGKGNHREGFLAGRGADSPVLVEPRDDVESTLVWRCKPGARTW